MSERRPLITHALRAAVLGSAAALALLGAWLGLRPDSELVWMTWNLFLAWIPLGLGWLVVRLARGAAPLALIGVAAACWLLFLPNAPYMVTDLVHLRDEGGPVVLDLAVLSAFAFTGTALFVASVATMQEAVALRLGSRPVRLVVPACIWLSSVGIYLGRVLRWNSWDVLGDPAGRLVSLAAHLSDPGALALALASTLALAALLHLAWAAASLVAGRLPRP